MRVCNLLQWIIERFQNVLQLQKKGNSSIPFPCEFLRNTAKHDLWPFVICANDALVAPTAINFTAFHIFDMFSIPFYERHFWFLQWKFCQFQIMNFWGKYLNIEWCNSCHTKIDFIANVQLDLVLGQCSNMVSFCEWLSQSTTSILLCARFVTESTSRTRQTTWTETEQMNGKNESDLDDTDYYCYYCSCSWCAHDTDSWFMYLKKFIK